MHPFVSAAHFDALLATRKTRLIDLIVEALLGLFRQPLALTSAHLKWHALHHAKDET